ncbi:TPA: hypothetical protein ACH3X3_012983 [Trebouxia sp. C0006]
MGAIVSGVSAARLLKVTEGPEPQGLKHYALKVRANGEIMLSIAGCLLQDAEYKNYKICEDTKKLKLKTALCMQATSGLGNALSKCHITREDFEQACIHLAELVEEYEPELVRLPENAPKYASAQAVQEYVFSKQRALCMLQRAKVILLNNSPSQFLGHALGQIAAASQGKMVQNFVMESCDEGTRCFEIAEVLKDFKQDFLEAQNKAAERHSMRVQELEHQILTATQEGQQLIVCNQGLQGQMHAIITREIALHRAFYAQRRQLASMNTQTMDDKAQHQAEIKALQMDADRMAASNAVLQQRAEVAEAAQAALKQRTEDAEAAKATLEKQAQAANEVCTSVQRRLHESQQTNKSLRCQLNEQKQVVEGLQADSGKLQTELSAEQERARDCEQKSQSLKSQLNIEEQKTGELVATSGEERAQALQPVQDELSIANSKLADSQKESSAAHQNTARLQTQMVEAESNASELQTQLTAAQQDLLTEQQDHRDAKQTIEDLQARLQGKEEKTLQLQTQLAKAQKQISVDTQAHEDAAAQSQAEMEAAQQGHEDAIAKCQRQSRAAQQMGALLQTKWKEGQQEVASERQAHQAAKQTVAEVQLELGKEASRAKSLHQDLQEAQADLASLKQASQAGAEAAPAPQMQQEEAAQHRSSTLQNEQILANDLSRVQTQHGIPTALLQEKTSGKDNNTLLDEQTLAEEASRGQAKQGTPTASLQQGAPGRDPSTLLDEQTLAEEVTRGQAKQGTPTAPLQQDTPGRDPGTLLDLHDTSGGQARQAGKAAVVPPQMQQEEAALLCPSSLQELHGSDAELNGVTKSQPEAAHDIQLTAALRQAHPPAAPQDEAALTSEVTRGQAQHGTLTAPLQQETSGMATTTLPGDLDAQPELQTLQKDLQGAKAALHLSNDKLKDSDSTIGRMHDRIEVQSREVSALKGQLGQAQGQLGQAQGQLAYQYRAYSALQDKAAIPELMMTAEGWVNVQAIGRGANGSVYHGTSALYPSGVLKRGDQENLWAEADLMHKINHPNMGQVYCKMTSSEISPNGRQIGYLVMKPLGRSLRALLAQRGRRGCLQGSWWWAGMAWLPASQRCTPRGSWIRTSTWTICWSLLTGGPG